MRDRNVIVLAVRGRDDSAYHRFVQGQGMDMMTVRDSDKKSNELYGPTFFRDLLIDRNGVLRGGDRRDNWTAQEMTEYLTKAVGSAIALRSVDRNELESRTPN